MTKREMFAWILIAAVFIAAPSAGNMYLRYIDSIGAVAIGNTTTTANRLLINIGYMQPPVCPTSLVGLEFGSICRQPGTGKILVRGIVETMP